MADKRNLVVALTRGGILKNTLGKSRNETFTWPKLVEKLSNAHTDSLSMTEFLALSKLDQSTRKNQIGAFVGGSFSNGRRNSDTIEFRSVVTLDIDENSQGVWDDISFIGGVPGLEGLAYQLHTTRKHTEDSPRLRIVLPLSRDVTPEEYVPILCAVAEMVDPSMKAVTTESFVAVQVMFLPTVCNGSDFYAMSSPGDFLNPDPLLKKYPVDEPDKWPKAAGGAVKPFSRAKMTHPEDKKSMAPIITAVHRAFTPTEFLDEFLYEVYEAAGERYSIIGATGAPSVRIYDDAFIQSDHGSDPANGQHNTFDLGRIHLFGDLDEDFDTAGMSLADWPSFKAMTEFMLERDEVRDALAEVEAENEEERNGGMLELLGDLDDEDDDADEDDLIGSVAPKKEKAKTIEEVLRRVKIAIGKATSLDDLERRLDVVRGFSTDDFRDLHRDLCAPDIMRKFKELTGEAITKATARKMLAPTIESLRKQMEGQELPEWLKPWVYLSSENKFLNLDTKQLLPKDGFNGLFSGEAGEEHGTNNFGLPKVLPSDLAQSVYMVPKPYMTKFHPDKPPMFEEEGILYVNSYRRTHVQSGGYKGKEGVKLLKRLLVDLFPEPEHQRMVLDFIAHCVRFPGRKLKYALLVKGCENEGKSLFAELVKKLLGTHNCMTIGNEQLTEKFNGWAFEKLFCTLEEIKINGREAHEVLNKLKPVITNPEIPIRRMRMDATHELNFCNLYLTTNYDDSLPMAEDNSRYLVLFTRFLTNQEVKDWHAELKKTEGKVYTRDLWDHIQDRPAQFLDFFAKYEFSSTYDADGGRAPDTIFKRVMAEDSKSDERVLLDDMLASETDPTITGDVLVWANFRALLDARDMAPGLRNRAVSGFLKPMGFVKAKKTTIRIDKETRTVSVWTKNMSIVDRKEENALTEEGRQMVKNAILTVENLDDGEDLRMNVIQMHKKR